MLAELVLQFSALDSCSSKRGEKMGEKKEKKMKFSRG
jgi:hypothetical protein